MSKKLLLLHVTDKSSNFVQTIIDMAKSYLEQSVPVIIGLEEGESVSLDGDRQTQYR